MFVATGEVPETMYWMLADSNTDKGLVKGRPYTEAFGGWYDTKAFLPDGDFVFTINQNEEGLSIFYYVAYVESILAFYSELYGGSTFSHSFTLTLVQMSSSSLTESLIPSSSMSPSVASSLLLHYTERCDLIEIVIDFDWVVWPISWAIWMILPSGDEIMKEGLDGGDQQTYVRHV